MKGFKKITALGMVLSMTAAMATGCGSSSQTAASTDDTAASAVAASAASTVATDSASAATSGASAAGTFTADESLKGQSISFLNSKGEIQPFGL